MQHIAPGLAWVAIPTVQQPQHVQLVKFAPGSDTLVAGQPTAAAVRTRELAARPAISSPAFPPAGATALVACGCFWAAGRRSARRGRARAIRPFRVGVACAAEDGGSSSSSSDKPPEAAAEAKPPRRMRVLSGVQPTGDIHLGNYFGAINQWTKMQDEYDCFFCVVDLHAITVPHKPKELRKSTLTTTAAYLASGIDPARSAVFVQSHVPQHSQLSWLLNTQTPMSWLEKMTQYKEKARKQQDRAVGLGLFAYPVLMAADILLYQADRVPVGEDQFEHLCLARDIAERMNKEYKKTAPKKRRLFQVPEALIGKEGARVMGLGDGTKKMSKSDPNENSRICLTDPPDVIKRKVKRCKTDTLVGLELDNDERPEARNLLRLYALCRRESPQVVAAECSEDNWGTFKGKLTEALVEYLTPIQDEYKRILDDETYLKDTLAQGRDKATEVASRTLTHVEAAMGFGY